MGFWSKIGNWVLDGAEKLAKNTADNMIEGLKNLGNNGETKLDAKDDKLLEESIKPSLNNGRSIDEAEQERKANKNKKKKAEEIDKKIDKETSDELDKIEKNNVGKDDTEQLKELVKGLHRSQRKLITALWEAGDKNQAQVYSDMFNFRKSAEKSNENGFKKWFGTIFKVLGIGLVGITGIASAVRAIREERKNKKVAGREFSIKAKEDISNTKKKVENLRTNIQDQISNFEKLGLSNNFTNIDNFTKNAERMKKEYEAYQKAADSTISEKNLRGDVIVKKIGAYNIVTEKTISWNDLLRVYIWHHIQFNSEQNEDAKIYDWHSGEFSYDEVLVGIASKWMKQNKTSDLLKAKEEICTKYDFFKTWAPWDSKDKNFYRFEDYAKMYLEHVSSKVFDNQVQNIQELQINNTLLKNQRNEFFEKYHQAIKSDVQKSGDRIRNKLNNGGYGEMTNYVQDIVENSIKDDLEVQDLYTLLTDKSNKDIQLTGALRTDLEDRLLNQISVRIINWVKAYSGIYTIPIDELPDIKTNMKNAWGKNNITLDALDKIICEHFENLFGEKRLGESYYEAANRYLKKVDKNTYKKFLTFESKKEAREIQSDTFKYLKAYSKIDSEPNAEQDPYGWILRNYLIKNPGVRILCFLVSSTVIDAQVHVSDSSDFGDDDEKKLLLLTVKDNLIKNDLLTWFPIDEEYYRTFIDKIRELSKFLKAYNKDELLKDIKALVDNDEKIQIQNRDRSTYRLDKDYDGEGNLINSKIINQYSNGKLVDINNLNAPILKNNEDKQESEINKTLRYVENEKGELIPITTDSNGTYYTRKNKYFNDEDIVSIQKDGKEFIMSFAEYNAKADKAIIDAIYSTTKITIDAVKKEDENNKDNLTNNVSIDSSTF